MIHLNRIIGMNCSKSSQLALHPSKTWVAYPAGGIVVVYDFVHDLQEYFLIPTEDSAEENRGAHSPRSISCVCFSADGRYLAAGESGQNPRILIWDIDEGDLVSSSTFHKFGVLAVKFSPDGKFLVSVGYQHDAQIALWEWRAGRKVASSKSSAKSGKFFVTVGTRHIKYWLLEDLESSDSALTSKHAILGEHKDCDFVDVCCQNERVFAITSSGMLVFVGDDRVLEKWVDVKMTSGEAIAISKEYVFCSGSDSTIRLFEVETLKYVSTAPKTISNGSTILATVFSQISSTIVLVDASKSLKSIKFDYPDSFSLVQSAVAHSDAIWSLKPNQAGQIITCSSDCSLRLWDTKIGTQLEILNQSHPIKAIATFKEFLVTGDSIGNIRVYTNLQYSYEIEAHDGEVLFLEFESGYLVSSSRDRLIHIFDPEAGFQLLQTFEYSCSIPFAFFKSDQVIAFGVDKSVICRDVSDLRCTSSINLKSAASDVASADNGLYVAQDKSIVFFVGGRQEKVVKLPTLPSSINKMAFDQESRYVALATADKYINIIDTSTGKFIEKVTGHPEGITSIRFIGQQLVSVGIDGCIFIWDCSSLIRQLERALKVDVADKPIADADQLRDSTFSISGKLPVWAREVRPLARSPVKKVPTTGLWIERLGEKKSFALFSENADHQPTVSLGALYDPRRYSSDSISQSSEPDISSTIVQNQDSEDSNLPEMATPKHHKATIQEETSSAFQSAAEFSDSELTNRDKKADKEVKRLRERLAALGILPKEEIDQGIQDTPDAVQELLRETSDEILRLVGVTPGDFTPIDDTKLREIAKNPHLVENLEFFTSYLMACIKSRLNK